MKKNSGQIFFEEIKFGKFAKRKVFKSEESRKNEVSKFRGGFIQEKSPCCGAGISHTTGLIMEFCSKCGQGIPPPTRYRQKIPIRANRMGIFILVKTILELKKRKSCPY
jgi:hypothetical protein